MEDDQQMLSSRFCFVVVVCLLFVVLGVSVFVFSFLLFLLFFVCLFRGERGGGGWGEGQMSP